MKKIEFMSPQWSNYNSNEMDEIKVLRKIIFHLIREIDILRETNIQKSILENQSPKDSIYGKLYKEICIESYNSAGPSSGEDKIMWDWFNRNDELPDETIMLRKLGYSEDEIKKYLEKIAEVSQYT
jgi:hypothetical protein